MTAACPTCGGSGKAPSDVLRWGPIDDNGIAYIWGELMRGAVHADGRWIADCSSHNEWTHEGRADSRDLAGAIASLTACLEAAGFTVPPHPAGGGQ